jgi:hypothetical protein
MEPDSMRLDVPVPTGIATTGDWFLLAARCEGTVTEITVDDVGFTPLVTTTGVFNNWQRVFQRPFDGHEPTTWHVDGLELYGQAVVLVIRNADPGTPFTSAVIETTTGTNVDAPTHTISAVTTTVNKSLVVIGYTSFWSFTMGDDVTLSPPDPTLIVSADDTTPLRTWTLAVPTAGTVGPWAADRSTEAGPNTSGVISWTVVAKPASTTLPSVVDHATSVAYVYAATPPSPIYLTGPNGEQAIIQGATLAEQTAAVAAQLAVWAAAASVESYLAAIDGFITANASFLASPGSSDPELVDVVEQLQMIHAALKQRIA